ncbi:TnsA endonuclease N-terminal domain-containing protein [Halalkalibacter urbisdiaboli]|uniref:TnsA endonuclease N-terminal domain-containing protein n=1 Tax=Halalkalibacter urbisdiaboli TaxID=1960589 RepID=UPI001FDA78D7|nr:TnsA endonuclease N-terminal domain-containing protein [Halalkalibacter urbisdiaboli]
MIEDFDLFCCQKGISDENKKYINNSIRSAKPARRVRSGAGNVPGFYSSKKMGLTIQFESHKLELCAIYLMEFDKSVYEYYDQPESFTINYKLNGKNRGHKYTADFFVISEDFVGWEEWKTEKELSKKVEESPHMYILDENGEWRCPPAEAFAKSKGLSFRVRCSKEIDWNLQNNLRFLEDYLLEENPTVSLTNRNIILSYVQSTPSITLNDLLSVKDAAFTADDIYKLIVLGAIYVDLERFLIINFDKFPLFLNKETATAILNAEKAKITKADGNFENKINVEVGKEILWNGNPWTVVNIGESEISLLDETERIIPLPINSFEELIKMGSISSFANEISKDYDDSELINIIRTARPETLAEANEKYNKYRLHMEGEIVDVSPRTLRYWKQKVLKAEVKYGSGFYGLIPENYKKGNTTNRLSDGVIKLMNHYITEVYEDKKQRSKSAVYNAFKAKCKEKGYNPPSNKTFFKAIEDRPSYEQDKKRRGPKAAYDKEPFYWELSLTTPRHGARPFEIAHIDHTELDIRLICSKTQKKLGKPWLTLLIDAYSRRVLAYYLTFDPPSYRSCMNTIRECVKKYSRIPKTLVVDGGKDFQSTYFDTLLASNDCHKKTRPGAKPKFGSVCERLFGTTNTKFIYNLAGNTQLSKLVRQMTKDFDPSNLAIWTLEILNEYLSKWFYEIYDQDTHTGLDQSPRDAYQQRIKITGERKQTYIKYDENFEMLTFPTTPKGKAKVQPGQGVKINNSYYNSYELSNPEIEGKQVPVRYDPFNYSKAYAYVGKYWVTLYSQYELEFEGRSEKEIKLVTEEIRKRKKETQKQKNNGVSASEIASFLSSAEAHELLEMQRLKDEALRKSLKVINGGKSKDNLKSTNEKAIKNDKDVANATKVTPKKKEKSTTEFEDFSEFKDFGEFF